jgi:hypothetical protein
MHGAIPPLPQYVFMEWYLVKRRDNQTKVSACTVIFLMESAGTIKIVGESQELNFQYSIPTLRFEFPG